VSNTITFFKLYEAYSDIGIQMHITYIKRKLKWDHIKIAAKKTNTSLKLPLKQLFEGI
jgi:hypothetical protein